MTVGSPSVYLLWAILSTVFQCFLILHLWSYDRFQCIKWNSGRQPGAFKRVMTYSYLGTLPLLVIFSISMAVIKYREGFLALPDGMVTPRPTDFWDSKNRTWILPLNFILSFAWGFELITHLEELTFWLFLLHQGPSKRDWFHSWEFRLWYLGSMIASIGMPLTVLIRRTNLTTCTAWVFVAGSAAGLSITLAFIYVLARFPHFIRYVKSEGAEPDVVVRLTKFYQLNIIRVAFRFIYTVSLLAVGIDGVQGPHPIARSAFWLDFLLMLGGIGCFLSSLITLFIFFPRSITRESGYYPTPHNSVPGKTAGTPTPPDYHGDSYSPKSPVYPHHARLNAFRFPEDDFEPSLHSLQRYTSHRHYPSGEATPVYESDPENDFAPRREEDRDRDSVSDDLYSSQSHQQAPDTARSSIQKTQSESHLPIHSTEVYHLSRQANFLRPPTETHSTGRIRAPEPLTTLHPYVMTFTSPIDLLDLAEVQDPQVHHLHRTNLTNRPPAPTP